MTIKLSKAEERYVRQLIADGKYATADEAVSNALTVLRKIDEMLPAASEDLRREIDLGLRDIENSRLINWNAKSLKRELQQKTRKVS
jgi:Arc/MetJ-type ribon-helix-helix transcriptional regulator